MTTAIDLKQKLLEEAAKRDLVGMNVRELEEFARLINAIANIPEKSYTDSMLSIIDSARNGFNGGCAS